jgi:uncharacterized peroxidase-related enzyme
MAKKQREERLTWLPVPERAEVPDEVASLWERALEKLGFVPNVLRVWALRPEHLLRWRRYMDELMKGDSGLTEAQREMIGVVVSSTNRCHYCVTSHSAVLRALTGDPVLVDQLAVNYRHAPVAPKERAMLDHAVRVTEASFRMGEDDVDRLREAGWDDEDVFDITEVAAMFNLTNRMANALGWAPNEEYHRLGR